ncbi:MULTISPECIES: hypothetical protein [Sorangium]|uniref:Uncharacterized protein n=1 Tax=Sorangium cellulosum TaxID=56 RepID=A0A4P2R270_SORCE|nr:MULTISPECIES: hypothetical protein [Sorangium]AUX37050.1 uncharacterized protein SOCE836_092690 [Sorangium cellulosum]WCQ96343.1 hypothetical protein NQZ70_09129 [Sorangium sp. Soce836]
MYRCGLCATCGALALATLYIIGCGLVGYFAGAVSARPRALTGVYRTSGAMMIGMGVKLAFERRT